MTTDALNARLRMANPVPLVEATDAWDASELFAQITAQPGDRRLAPSARRSGAGRRRVALVLVFGLLAVLASTAFAVSHWVLGDAVRPPVTHHEYQRAQHQLTLPPGVTWPQLHIQPNSLTGRGAGGGHAVGIAQNAWECYWVRAIDRGDVAAERRAHAELEALLTNNVIVAPKNASENWTPPNPPKAPYEVFADDGGYQWVQAMYKKAAAGDTQDLRSSCRANSPR
jgi:hypothetical protein